MPRGRIHHIGVVVDDLEEAIEFLRTAFGLSVDSELSLPSASAAFLSWGPVQIELIEISDANLRQQRLGDAPARIEHIAVQVDDIDQTFSALLSTGVRSRSDAPEDRPGSSAFFTLPETSDGVTYQLLELKSDEPKGA